LPRNNFRIAQQSMRSSDAQQSETRVYQFTAISQAGIIHSSWPFPRRRILLGGFIHTVMKWWQVYLHKSQVVSSETYVYPVTGFHTRQSLLSPRYRWCPLQVNSAQSGCAVTPGTVWEGTGLFGEPQHTWRQGTCRDPWRWSKFSAYWMLFGPGRFCP